MVPCCGLNPPGQPCTLCSGVSSSAVGCSYVPTVCQDPYYPSNPTVPEPCSPGDPLDLCWPAQSQKAKAWEGAFYSREGYWRMKRECRMQQLTWEIGFSEACALRINQNLCVYGDPLTCPDPVATLGSCPAPTQPPTAPETDVPINEPPSVGGPS